MTTPARSGGVKRVRVSVPRLPGHLVEFGLTGPVTLFGPEFTYSTEAVDPRASAATVAQLLIAEVAEGRVT